ncbi:MAG: isoprenylcysteine carboxylmethyltransferase family protein [Patescibacteria group bacterium]
MAEDVKSTTDELKDKSYRDGLVHLILSHSYTVFWMAVVLGLILDIYVPIGIFYGQMYQYVGAGMIILGSIIIYWAQSTTNCTLREVEKGICPIREFARGPYKYSRNPTHIGLFIMTLGLAFILNSLFSIILVVVAFLITKLVFVKKEECLLEEKYGDIYCDYKKKVRTWI